jgi:hypothetical protein
VHFCVRLIALATTIVAFHDILITAMGVLL